jgi:hypothetical protein
MHFRRFRVQLPEAHPTKILFIRDNSLEGIIFTNISSR